MAICRREFGSHQPYFDETHPHIDGRVQAPVYHKTADFAVVNPVGEVKVAFYAAAPFPVIVVERLAGIRNRSDKGKRLKRRFHSLPFRKVRHMIEYKCFVE